MQRTTDRSSYVSTPKDNHVSKHLTSTPSYSSQRIKGKFKHLIITF